MVRRSEPVTVVDAAADRDALRPLLEEYHDWLRTEHCEWADRTTAADVAPVSEADIADRAADDLRTLADPAVDSGAFLAGDAEAPAGCVLYYGVSGGMAEMKRLYVRPARRGDGLGRALVAALVDATAAGGYERLGLTTPPWSRAAHALYEDLGFEYVPPYPETKLPEHLHDEALFMTLDLENRRR